MRACDRRLRPAVLCGRHCALGSLARPGGIRACVRPPAAACDARMSDRKPPGRLRQVLALGSTQILAWASSTYLPAILALPIARDLDISRSTVFGAFSVSLVVMALAGPAVGRTIDRNGGRSMLASSNLLLAAGLVLLGLASNVALLFAAWCVLGLGMAMGLYDAAFATLVRLHAHAAREPITGITLIAGFASTVGWPLTTYVAEHFGWRASAFVWAAMHLCVALPLNLSCIPSFSLSTQRPDEAAPNTQPAPDTSSDPQCMRRHERRAFLLLALFAAFTSFVTSAMAAHLHGPGNGMITIAKGTLPLAVFGPGGYGFRQGLLNALARGMQAIAPFVFGLVLDVYGVRLAIGVSAGLSLLALSALLAMHKESDDRLSGKTAIVY